ncbi:putative nucleic acid-binding protein, contains PIN domain [Methanophagales archaeon]|nr:putative nucleic acid-binding protein, contains PIN domain [Methanophagales archaeon]
MTTIYLDASALIAYFNKADEFHESACPVIDSTELNLELFTSDVTVLELQYVLWRKISGEVAIEKTQGVMEAEDIYVLSTNTDDIFRELEIFKRYPMPSFDALICAVMQREGIKFLLSFDRGHFDAVEGITRVENLKDLKTMLR